MVFIDSSPTDPDGDGIDKIWVTFLNIFFQYEYNYNIILHISM